MVNLRTTKSPRSFSLALRLPRPTASSSKYRSFVVLGGEKWRRKLTDGLEHTGLKDSTLSTAKRRSMRRRGRLRRVRCCPFLFPFFLFLLLRPLLPCEAFSSSFLLPAPAPPALPPFSSSRLAFPVTSRRYHETDLFFFPISLSPCSRPPRLLLSLSPRFRPPLASVAF